jgi:L-aspartate oxidase
MDEPIDFLVIGSGIAGLWFAHRAADFGNVVIFTKKDEAESATNLAQGGIASPMSRYDSIENHVNDTLTAGDGLCHRVIVRKVVGMAPGIIQDLIDIGVKFTYRRRSGRKPADLDLGREGGHSERRIVHAADLTGREIERALLEQVRSRENITFFENYRAIDLITTRGLDGKRTVRGVWVLDDQQDTIIPLFSSCILLATGGTGRVYRYTTNPVISTGDGVAMAYRAGCRVGNMEFVQFHPTALALPGAGRFLISEAIRGAGGILRNEKGEAFMPRYHRLADLAPRDIVARAIFAEIQESSLDHAFLDVTHLKANYIKSRFPNITRRCSELGLDITREPLPVVPAAHYMCGGVVTDARGRTDIRGLLTAGEVAFTGMHGANRLASNSLLEAVCFAELSAREARRSISARPREWPLLRLRRPGGKGRPISSRVIQRKIQQIRDTMSDNVGIVRERPLLAKAREKAAQIRRWADAAFRKTRITEDMIEVRNLALIAELIATGAYRRVESRGLHFLREKPRRDDQHWHKDNLLKPRTR